MSRKWMVAIPAVAFAFTLAGCGDICSNNEPVAAPPPAPRHEEPPPPPPPPPPAEEKPTPPPPPPPQESQAEKELVEHGRLRLENVYFATAKATLLPESEASLREAGEALEKYPDLKIRVEGHTDKRGGAAYNMRLSQARANTVRDWLVSHYNLRKENYSAKGYGFTRPENKGNTPEELARNRRVVLTVLNPEALPHNVELEKPKN
jgi:OOP family OmpA-OmpF porin